MMLIAREYGDRWGRCVGRRIVVDTDVGEALRRTGLSGPIALALTILQCQPSDMLLTQ